MTKAINPILKGFNPDPSIIKVKEDYFIATSTFEWFPGVQIHHSRDLINWKLIGRPLTRVSQLDMKGVPDSCGVWAPCLSYDNGIFYLVYSNVKSFDGVWKDTPNYLVTSDSIDGEWSDPIFLSSAGFDGSLFHDTDGRKWYTSMLVDHREGKFFGGIILQEYDPVEKKLTGEVHHIFEGSKLGITEGPHLYKIGDYYYLITAEGGTEYGHAVTVARSKNILGPYEIHPDNPIVSSRNNPEAPLQRTGHGDIVQTQHGDWYIVFLCGRPITQQRRCTLGRETAIEPLDWKNDWPYLASGKSIASVEADVSSMEEHSVDPRPQREDFDDALIPIDFQSLRVPMTSDWISVTERKGWLRLYGRESLSSLHSQSLVARRVQSFNISASTCLEFDPVNFQQMAGLVCYYNTNHYFYLHVTLDNGLKTLKLIENDKGEFRYFKESEAELRSNENIYLRADFHKESIRFYFRQSENDWKQVGPELDGSILSDDYVRDDENKYKAAFTGAFVGLCCQDLTGAGNYADFDWFEYTELK